MLRSVLNRPQGSQRGSLCRRQTLHSADIQSFVGPVTLERPQPLAARQILEVDDIVIPATGKSAAIRADLERLDCTLMPFAHPHALLMLKVPPAQHAIAAAAEQQFSRRAPGQRVHFLARLAQGVQSLPAPHIPDEKLPTAFTPTTTGKQAPIRTPRDPHDYATMPFQRCSHRPLRELQ